MNVLRRLLLMSPALSWLAAPAMAASCGRYTLAFFEFGALYQRGADGQHQGIDKDVAAELARRSGCLFDTVLESRVRIWDQLSRGALDLSVSGIATPERERFAEFVPYFQTRNYALMRRELVPALGSAAAFLAEGAGRQVAVVRSFKHGPHFDGWLEALRQQRRVTEAADFEQCLRLFRFGRVDLLLAQPIAWVPMLQREPALAAQIQVLDWAPQERVTHGLVMSRSRVSEADRQQLRRALRSMLDDGTVTAIIGRHVGEALAQNMRLAAAELPSAQ